MNLLDLDNDCLNIIGDMVKKDNKISELELKKSCYKKNKQYHRITDIGLTMLKEVGLKPTDVIEEYNPYIDNIDNNDEVDLNIQILVIKINKKTEKKWDDYSFTYNKNPYYTWKDFDMLMILNIMNYVVKEY